MKQGFKDYKIQPFILKKQPYSIFDAPLKQPAVKAGYPNQNPSTPKETAYILGLDIM